MEHAFHFFPAACPDETLHSLLSRYVRLSGLGSWAAVFDAATGDGSFARDLPLPCHLGELLRALPTGVNLDQYTIISRHTLLPYYQPFLTERQLIGAQTQMLNQGGNGLKLRLGLIASRLESTSRTRFCPTCVSKDLKHYGTAYWHRVHQLPGVWICPHDQSPLLAVDHHWLARGLRKLYLPLDEEVQRHSFPLQFDSRQRRSMLSLAQSSLRLLQANAPPQSAIWLREHFLKGATECGLASTSGRLYLSQVADYLGKYFETLPASSEFLILRGAVGGQPASWITKLLRKPRRTHHPLKYLLLANALSLDLSSVLTYEKNICPQVWRPTPSCSDALDSCVPDGPVPYLAECVGALKKGDQSIWEKAISGAGAQEIARSLGVSAVRVYRAIRSISGGREKWKQMKLIRERTERRGRFTSQYLKVIAHECKDYSWLYRNDQVWLKSYLDKTDAHARQQPTDPFKELDPPLAEKIVQCAHSIAALPGKPVHICKTRIGRELDALARFEKQLNRLPLCADALDAVCETHQEFRHRRLVWATEKLVELGKPITRSSIYRAACIRPPVDSGRESLK